MGELLRLVSLYQQDRLPKDITVIRREQYIDAYGEYAWPTPPPWREDDSAPLPEGATVETVEIRTIETPQGKIRAGYAPESRTLVIVEIVEGSHI